MVLASLLLLCGLDGAQADTAPSIGRFSPAIHLALIPAEAHAHNPSLSQDGNTEVEIPDSGLRCAVTKALGKALDETVTRDDLTSLQQLESSCEQSIGDLTGLEYAIHLHTLKLRENSITDLGPLSALTELLLLDLYRNSISDLGALSNLTRLQVLNLADNSVSSIEPLSGLSNVHWLNLFKTRYRMSAH